MPGLDQDVDSIAAATGFSGVVRVDRTGEIELAKAYGLADRGHGIPNTLDTQFAIASGSKGFTAAVVASLIEEGALDLSTTARSVLGADLPLIGDDVTVEHLLSHRSGIGDYFDEDAGHAIDDYVMPVPVQELATTEDYLAVLDGHPTVFPPGERFAYCNSGYVVLALIAERTSGVPFHELVRERVCEPAGMVDTEFLRSDELPGRAALGYLAMDGASRTNVFHLPVRGSGDGGVYSTVADIASFWTALFAGRTVPTDRVADLVRPRSEEYGLGCLASVGEHGGTGRKRRRRLVPQRPRSDAANHAHGDLERVRRRVADRTAARRTPGSVAEDGRTVSDPLHQRRGACNVRVADLLRVGEPAGVEADRAQPELPASVRELLEQPLERRAAVARLAVRLAGEAESHRVLRRPDDDVVALIERRRCDEERNRHPLGVLQPRRQIDEHLPGHVTPFVDGSLIHRRCRR